MSFKIFLELKTVKPYPVRIVFRTDAMIYHLIKILLIHSFNLLNGDIDSK